MAIDYERYLKKTRRYNSQNAMTIINKMRKQVRENQCIIMKHLNVFAFFHIKKCLSFLFLHFRACDRFQYWFIKDFPEYLKNILCISCRLP